MKKILSFIFMTLLVALGLTLASCTSSGHVIQTGDRNITSIAVDKTTVPTEIEIGSVNTAGIIIVITYSTNETEKVTLKENMIPAEYKELLTKPGTVTIAILYRGFTDTVTITMVEPVVIVTYTVKFYNGNNELISSQTINEGEDATEPTEAERDMEGYRFIGWDRGYTNITKDINVYGSYVKVESTPDTSTSSLYERVTENNKDYILFGSYPQTEVTDTTLKSSLTSLVGTLPTTSAANGFTSYKYYISSSNETDYMWYKDVTYSNDIYRAIYFTQYRPYYTSSSSATDYTYQDDNGYDLSTLYFFKYEPIKWNILNEANGSATILADLIIDSQEYNYTYNSSTVDGKTIYANNYEYSTIRKWLNENFYNTAFSELQKEIINLVEVDNSASTTELSTNQFACNNTQDKVWLMSYQDIYNTSYGFNSNDDRMKKVSDYAASQGAYKETNSSYLGNGCWWLRSPRNDISHYALSVYNYGDWYSDNVKYTSRGVVPALKITL